MSQTKKGNIKEWIHIIIGLILMFGIPMLPPMEPITEIGMQIGGIFIGAIYLWSMVGTFWPSLLAIVALGFTDYTDMNGIFAAFSGYLPLLMLFCMIFLGAIGDCGLTQYIGRWFLTRKIINGRPSVFNFMMMVAVFAVSAFIDPLMALLVLWPTLYVILEEVGYQRNDSYYRILIVATFMAVTLGQCTLPFFGGQLIILGAFEAASGVPTNYGLYILFNLITSLLIFLALTLFIKYVLRPDMSKMANISIEQINKNPLPPMNMQQKIYIIAAIAFLVAALAPSFLPADWTITQVLTELNLVGFTLLAIAVLAIIKVDGKPIMDVAHITKEYVSWDLYLLVVVAVYFSGCLLDDATGIKPWLIGILNPLFGSHGYLFFVIVLFVTGVILTNFANNAIVGAIFMQIIVAMAPSMNIDNPVPLAMTMTMAMFLAVLTPAASPYAAVLHANDRVSINDIYKYGGMMVILSLIIYIALGLPIANIIF